MTTLPQTTSGVRMPRPAMQLAGANGHVPALAANSAQVHSMTGADAWRVLRTNFWLISALLIVAAVAGYGLNMYLARHMPLYKATGYLTVLPIKSADLLHPDSVNDNMSDVTLEQKTQAAMLQSDSLLTRVLQNPDSQIRKTQWFKQFHSIQEAKSDFITKYSASPRLETKLVEVSFSWAVPSECKIIVEEMVEQHLKEQNRVTQLEQSDRSAQLTQLLEVTRGKLANDESQMSTSRQALNIDGMGTTQIGIKQIQLSELIREEEDLRANTNKAQAMYNYVTTQLKNNIDPQSVLQAVEQDPSVRQYRADMDALETRRQEQTATFGDNSRQVKTTDDMIASNNKRLSDATERAKANARAQVVEDLTQVLDSAKSELSKIESQVKQLEGEMGELSNQMAEYRKLEEESKMLQEKVNKIEEQLQQVQATESRNLQARVAWMQHPDVPTQMVFPKLSVVMGACIMVGLVLALGIAFLREVTDQSIRSPRDIARVGQLAVLGTVADEQDDRQTAGARLPLVIYDAPHSILAEQLRQVRTRLQHAAALDTTRSIMITSAGPGDGKTTIATNLAAGLALNGRRILLVDANFRRPELHRLFGLKNECGFSDVLAGSAPFDELVSETQVPNLSVMAAGPKPANATEMFESTLLSDFIERSLEEFDHVIFDTGPLMVVSESVAMAPRVDGVVTVVRARGNSRGLLQRMRELLKQVKADNLGVVLNAVRAQGGGYYGRSIKTYYNYNT